MYDLLSIYCTGALVFVWTSWFFEGSVPMFRVAEALLWPLGLVVGTVRKLMGRT